MSPESVAAEVEVGRELIASITPTQFSTDGDKQE